MAYMSKQVTKKRSLKLLPLAPSRSIKVKLSKIQNKKIINPDNLLKLNSKQSKQYWGNTMEITIFRNYIKAAREI
jgi:hypothetical protein